jgi:hypothetical protein
MAGLVPAIHVSWPTSHGPRLMAATQDVDARDKRGHDGYDK